MIQKKILITGGSGYIGNYVAKMLAAAKPDIQVIAMSRRSVQEQMDKDDTTRKFKNIRFHQGDCLKPETFPTDLKECDSVIHTVGTLVEGVDYKAAFEGRIPDVANALNPANILNQAFGAMTGGVKYNESHEALNRDACKLIAEHYNNARKSENRTGHFVFLSAAKTIAPMLSKYIEMKEQAESFLLNNCPQIIPVILKPGFVWHPSERQWSVPLMFATDIAYQVNKNLIQYLPGNQVVQGMLPQSSSIHLSLLTDIIIKGALGELDNLNNSRIWSNEQMIDLGNNNMKQQSYYTV